MNQQSKVEKAKQEGNFLRGSISDELPTDAPFEHDSMQLLKFHGTYQQDDRDQRIQQRQRGQDRLLRFMIRCTIPAGILSAEQYLALDNLADQHADGTLRITTRQSIQFHGVLKRDLKPTISAINRSLLTTLAACGDVQRNVMACPAPIASPAHQTVRRIARELGTALMPKTNAYHEIWLDGEKWSPDASSKPKAEEDFYGKQYLPRKFKTGVTLDGENGIDVYSYDAGLMGITEHQNLLGFNVLAGGGMGMSHGRANTFAQLAHEVGFVAVDDAIPAMKVIASIYRDFGNRKDRKQARLKYLIDTMGLDTFLDRFKERASFRLQPPRECSNHFQDYLGQHAQKDGKYFYGLFVQSGRIKDTETSQTRTAIREIVDQLRPEIILTAQQSLLFSNLSNSDIQTIESILKSTRVTRVNELSAVRRYSMACPALPTCGMALAESERMAPQILTQFEDLLQQLNVSEVPLSIRITGCPNGCARPYTADIALVGRRPGIYHVFVGGRLAGDRITDLYAADIAESDVIKVLTPLLSRWASDRKRDEGLGDFYRRIAPKKTRSRITGKETETRSLVQLQVTV